MQTPEVFEVCDVKRELEDVVTLTLAAPQRSVDFMPGQFSMLYLFGHGEIPISISGDPAERSALLHTVRGVGTVSNACVALKSGTKIGVRGPFGSSWPVEACDDRDVYVIAGGLGIAPLRPLLYALLKRKRHSSLSLYYGCRTPLHSLFKEQLDAWSAEGLIQYHMTVDYPAPGYKGHVGVVTNLLARQVKRPEQSIAYLCGPEVMMRFCVAALETQGLRAEQIYLALERNMKCALGWCGRCQFGPVFVCKDGPVFPYSKINRLLAVREL